MWRFIGALRGGYDANSSISSPQGRALTGLSSLGDTADNIRRRDRSHGWTLLDTAGHELSGSPHPAPPALPMKAPAADTDPR